MSSCIKQTKAKFGGEKPKDKEKLADYTAALDKCRRDRNNKVIDSAEEKVKEVGGKVTTFVKGVIAKQKAKRQLKKEEKARSNNLHNNT
jgi:hypothetical protein